MRGAIAMRGALRLFIVLGEAAFLTSVGSNQFPVGPTVGGFNPKLAGYGYVGGFQVTVSNATSPDQLGGFSTDVMAGFANGAGGSVDVAIQSGGQIQSTLTVGVGEGGFGGAGILQFTSVQPVCRP